MPGSSDSGSAPLTMTRSAGGSRRAQPPTSRTATSREKISQLEGSLHEPAGTARGFGVRQSSGAFGSGPRAQKRQRTAAVQDASAPAAASSRFMVPMHAPKREEAFPEQQSGDRIFPAAEHFRGCGAGNSAVDPP